MKRIFYPRQTLEVGEDKIIQIGTVKVGERTAGYLSLQNSKYNTRDLYIGESTPQYPTNVYLSVFDAKHESEERYYIHTNHNYLHTDILFRVKDDVLIEILEHSDGIQRETQEVLQKRIIHASQRDASLLHRVIYPLDVLIDNIDKLPMREVLVQQQLPTEFFLHPRVANRMTDDLWRLACCYHTLSEEVIDMYPESMDWEALSRKTLSPSTYEKYKDRLFPFVRYFPLVLWRGFHREFFLDGPFRENAEIVRHLLLSQILTDVDLQDLLDYNYKCTHLNAYKLTRGEMRKFLSIWIPQYQHLSQPFIQNHLGELNLFVVSEKQHAFSIIDSSMKHSLNERVCLDRFVYVKYLDTYEKYSYQITT